MGMWGFCVPSRMANESWQEEILDKMLAILRSAFPCQFSLWFLSLVFFTMAQLKQKECKESHRMGVILAAMNSSHSKWGWCRNMYLIRRQVCCCASYCTGLPSCFPSPHSSFFLWDACPRSALRILNPHQDYCCTGLFKILPMECFLLVHSV